MTTIEEEGRKRVEEMQAFANRIHEAFSAAVERGCRRDDLASEMFWQTVGTLSYEAWAGTPQRKRFARQLLERWEKELQAKNL